MKFNFESWQEFFEWEHKRENHIKELEQHNFELEMENRKLKHDNETLINDLENSVRVSDMIPYEENATATNSDE